MFKNNTLLIVGAGASKEAGMPTGAELSKIIAENLNYYFEFDEIKRGDYQLHEKIRVEAKGEEYRALMLACRKISDGIFLSGSIDNFIDMHADDPAVSKVGKLAIAHFILKYEAKSKLVPDPKMADARLDLNQLQDTWYDAFVRILFERVPRSEVERIGQDVSIISFNYDRCIQQYIHYAVKQAYQVNDEIAYQIVSGLDIVHPYGCVGEFVPANYRPIKNGVRYGQDSRSVDLHDVARNLYTYTEQIEGESIIERIRHMVARAKCVVFLGFAFHPQNMELLKLQSFSGVKRVYSTGRGISNQEMAEVKRRIDDLFLGERTGLNDPHSLTSIEIGASCKDLFDMNRMNLVSS